MDKFTLIYLLLINIIGFLLMFIDKKRAIRNKWRIQESTLFFIALLGGAIGTYLGMYTFRHKTKHLKFTIGIPLILISEIALFLYLSFIVL